MAATAVSLYVCRTSVTNNRKEHNYPSLSLDTVFRSSNMLHYNSLQYTALCVILLTAVVRAYKLPQSGMATVTHYLLGNAVGACDCATGANNHPVAAINQNSFGPANAAGPGCGRCFHLTIYAAISQPRYNIPASIPFPEVTLKVVDLCPAKPPNMEWCAQTDTKPNPHNAWVHFDISQTTIPDNFFPQPFGYDMGTWFANYTEVSCETWSGWGQKGTSGLAYPGAGCCPANPTVDGNLCKLPDGKNVTGVGSVSAAGVASFNSRWRTESMVAWIVAVMVGGWMMMRM